MDPFEQRGKENPREVLKKSFENLLYEYSGEPPELLSREERKRLRDTGDNSEVLERYEKSKFRGNWFGALRVALSGAKDLGVEPQFFGEKAKEFTESFPEIPHLEINFRASKEDVKKTIEDLKKRQEEFEYHVTPEMVAKANAILKESIEKLS